MDLNKASNETLLAMALDFNFAALRMELRAAGVSFKFGNQEEIDTLRRASDVLAQAANGYTRRVLIREGVTTEEELAEMMGAALGQKQASPEEKPRNATFFGGRW